MLSTQRTNPKTYQLTLQAWSILHRASQDSTGSIAMALANEALAHDPDYLLALNAMMLAAYQQQMDGEISEAEAGAINRDVRERILAIDPENSIANSYLAWELLWDEKEFAHANHHLQVALRTGLNHQETLRLLAGFARRTGNTEAAVHVGERALAIDPTCENCMWQETENLFYAGRFEEAIEGKKRIQKLGMGGYHNHAVMLLMNDQPNAALDLIAASTSPEQMTVIRAMAYHSLGDAGKFAENIASLQQLEGWRPQMGLAEVYAFTGENDLAFKALENAVDMGGRVQYQLFLPQWEDLRADRRWSDLRDRLDMTEEKLSVLDFSSIPNRSQ